MATGRRARLALTVLSRLFRRLFIEGLLALNRAGKLTFFGDLAGLSRADAFNGWLAPFRKSDWVVPFGGPEAALAYLTHYTHRFATSNSRLVSADTEAVTSHWKDYRIKNGDRQSLHRRVHAPLPDPCPTRRLSPHPSLWLEPIKNSDQLDLKGLPDNMTKSDKTPNGVHLFDFRQGCLCIEMLQK